MNISNIIRGGIGLLKAKIFRKKVPLIVGMALTNRCNLRCRYCNIYSIKSTELRTDEVLRIIEDLAKLGCIRIGFTGGEPLLREDISEIIKHCKENHISATITTNGYLLKRKIKEIKDVSLILVSLDGPKEQNDFIRGKGSFDKAFEAIHTAKKNKIKVAITTVISEINKDHLQFIFNLAKKEKIGVHFQFVSNIVLTKNIFSEHAISTEEKEKIIQKIIIEKRTNKYILNSLPGLESMKKISGSMKNNRCAAGNIFFRISADGKLYSCWRQSNNQYIDLTKIPLPEAIIKVASPKCVGCDIADGVELSLLYSLDSRAILNVLKKY
jgi:MoaA/NifB/PqqE/SkfB family radical SAM enzyme